METPRFIRKPQTLKPGQIPLHAGDTFFEVEWKGAGLNVVVTSHAMDDLGSAIDWTALVAIASEKADDGRFENANDILGGRYVLITEADIGSLT